MNQPELIIDVVERLGLPEPILALLATQNDEEIDQLFRSGLPREWQGVILLEAFTDAQRRQQAEHEKAGGDISSVGQLIQPVTHGMGQAIEFRAGAFFRDGDRETIVQRRNPPSQVKSRMVSILE